MRFINKILGSQLETPAWKLMNPTRRRDAGRQVFRLIIKTPCVRDFREVENVGRNGNGILLA